ncbi:lysophospholipase family protein [Aspergillus clavatus NRRL 1]|uniref:Lysophospholipase n=1 Tax=Aspergillus clavatus (strain ATCC 1007 / CBS 513.65 / DSM 816 / NCTC 3887 / NRRL 1 / QM 1276 / 107) TaxID=344612 RepID=A1CHI2_ASPCL|nr:lysophospholipase Plb1 [Aspergillus clavatus NRRL 1]EAW10337.1 lysophospholipase Plb1 [Aspergillus clavatus NRRL 1]
MKPTTIVCALAGLLPGVAAAPGPVRSEDLILQRALPNAPDGYTPSKVDCPPSRPTIRSAARLSPDEVSWLKTRREKTTSALKDFFNHVKIKDFDPVGYINQVAGNMSNVPNIGIAVSGGGYRALMNGAGAIKAFDSRTPNSTSSGQLGGLLQSATYLAGLSGGSWLLGSIYINNFTTISDLQTYEKGAVWQFQNSIFEGPDGDKIQILDSASYYKAISDAVSGKSDAGYPTSITDYWGRAISYQMVDAPHGGPSYTWSSIAKTDTFKQAEMPMPVVVADGRYPGELLISSNATIYEFNPWEFGTFDPTVFGFAPLEYLGTKFDGGSVPKNESCVRGYDNAGFVMGTSSTLFNQFLLQVNSTALPDFLKTAFTSILEKVGEHDEDIALYAPNPFYHYSNNTSPNADQLELDLVDGGEDLQNIPLHPLIQPERHVDVIFAVDSSADTTWSWPNGTALVATYERGLNTTGIGNGTVFPAVPDQITFVNNGLNTRPTFFGCNSSNMTGPSPLIVYLPNYPYMSYSNFSTFQPDYTEKERDDTIRNGYDVVTMGNSTRDSEWSTCVGCAILSRSFERTNTKVPEICGQCFQRYCWDGTTNNTTPAEYEPVTLLKSAASGIAPSVLASLMATCFALWALL